MAKRGRPTTYNMQVIDELLERLIKGESVAKITKDDHMPAESSVYEWLVIHKDFAERYALARKAQTFKRIDNMFDVIHSVSQTGVYIDAEGNKRIDNGAVQLAKLEVDNIKWIASKEIPRYSDKSEPEKPPEPTTSLQEIDSKLELLLKK